jgi:uncharacterized YigZ family protein
MNKEQQYASISGHTSALFKDRGSKFIAYAYPILSINDVKEKLQHLKKEHPKAVHHCYAYRIGTTNNEFRANDDGEPSGSAGRPILGQIDSAELTNVLIVVVRYFGGTLLGVPGLINAYKTAAAAALGSATIITKWVEHRVEITFDYSAMSEVLYLLKQCEASIYKQDLQLFCVINAGIPIVYTEEYLDKLGKIRGLEIKIIR